MKTPVVYDGRNLYRPEKMREMGFEYHSVGRQVVNPPPA
jgi:UDPglucose 6-dehydrogenase